MIVLDATVLIAHLDRTDAHHARATDFLLDAADEPLACSVVTLAEILVGPTRVGAEASVLGAVDQLGLVVHGLSPDDGQRIATLRVATGLKIPDCCVLLVAERSSAAVATFDDRLRRSAEERGVRVAP